MNIARFAAAASLALLLAGCGGGGSGGASGIERVVAFGDSNVDNGNLFALTGGRAPAPPNWQGRNSNGPSVVEYLADSLGARLEDHAVSGATSGELNIVGGQAAFAHVAKTGVAAQIDALAAKGARFGAGDLLVLWAGSNDIFGAARSDRTGLDQRIATAASNIEQAIVRLHGMGAMRFVVANRTPREVLGNDNDLNGVDLNKALAQAVSSARQRTGADVRLYDAYAAIADMMTRPAEYGFAEVRALCISVPSCAQDPQVGSTYVNWDGAHKTTRVHRLMAGQIAAGLPR